MSKESREFSIKASNEISALQPSVHLVEILKVAVQDLPLHFEFPEIYATSEGFLEIFWHESGLYGLLDEKSIEFEWIGDSRSHSKSYKHADRSSNIIFFIIQQLEETIY